MLRALPATVRTQLTDHVGSAHVRPDHIHHYDVRLRLHHAESRHNARQAREATRPFVILVQTFHVMIECEQSRRREHSRLPHGSAEAPSHDARVLHVQA